MTTIFLLATVVYSSILTGLIVFSRASRRRVLGAFGGGLVVALVGTAIEAYAHLQGWWSYSEQDTTIGPVMMYPLLVIMFTTIALLGWMIERKFGWRGLMGLLVLLAILGTVRDYQIAGKLVGMIVFAPNPFLPLIDAFLWLGLSGLAIGVMRLVSGPAGGDSKQGH